MSKSLKDIALSVFEANPNAEVVFFTSDGNPFLHSSMAISHARGLADRKIEQVSKSDLSKQDADPKYPEGTPTMEWRKVEIVAYLEDQKVDHDPNDNKTELLRLLDGEQGNNPQDPEPDPEDPKTEGSDPEESDK